ncbi:activator of HSP90 ATPase [Actinomadura soli]|uniref:Activator of HSP90 ATPase n=1 Tax=Actinomadura soli TaxID=2508997 RepID=A0A5C4J9S0_9ACTN|nr:SRPBCC domain-containing protein [Actinomadura soli]TMQ96186.1 activator of HSP90 ATPase [Actinomadura soli]
MSIEHEILIDAPVDVVWRTVTEPEQIAQWFSDKAAVDLRPGGDGTLTFVDKETAAQEQANLVVAAVEPPHRFAYRWGNPEGTRPGEGNSTLVEFKLVPDGDRTLLRVTETGLDETDWTDERKTAYIDDHNAGWSKHLADLATFAATGVAPK